MSGLKACQRPSAWATLPRLSKSNHGGPTLGELLGQRPREDIPHQTRDVLAALCLIEQRKQQRSRSVVVQAQLTDQRQRRDGRPCLGKGSE